VEILIRRTNPEYDKPITPVQDQGEEVDGGDPATFGLSQDQIF
jgi:hypothetical protein